MAEYKLSTGNVVHEFELPLNEGSVPAVVHLTQYDATIPIMAVSLWANGEQWVLPETASANVRMRKPDGKHVYDPCLGVSEDRTTVYVAVTAQMTAAAGKGEAIIEITDGGGVIGSGRLTMLIARNPVPADAYESSDEYKSLQDLIADAEKAAKAAAASADAADKSQKAASTSENNADKSAKDAAGSATAAAGSATKAAGSATAAAGSASAAKTSETAAKASQTAAKTSEINAADSAADAAESARQAQTIAQGALGYYENESALKAAHPTASTGNWAIVGSTDTIWVWDDTGTPHWEDSAQNIDLSQYYTKGEVDTRLEAKQDKPVDGSFVAAYPNAGAHNSIYRGKNIQDKYENGSLYTAISNGTFDDLYIGDYFDITISTSFMASEKVRCLLAGFDTYVNHGNPILAKHHAVIVPLNGFAKSAKMNDTNTTADSYTGSDMFKTILPVYATAIKNVFTTHFVPTKEWVGTAMTATTQSMAGLGRVGATTNCEWTDIDLRLMSEVEVYGTTVFSSSAWDVGSAVTRLPLFTLEGKRIVCGLGGANYDGTSSRSYWWLSAVSSASDFANVSAYGFANSNGASYTLGVRPRWLIG